MWEGKKKAAEPIIVNNGRFPAAFIFYLGSKCPQLFVSTSQSKLKLLETILFCDEKVCL